MLRELTAGMHGAWRLLRLDRGAMRYFDCSVAGAWRSFWAAALCYPGFLALLALRLDAAQIAHAGLPRIVIVETIGYIIGWTAYPCLALPLCRWLAPEPRALGFIIAYNWAQVLQTAILLAVEGALAGRLLATGPAAAVESVTYLLLLVYEWFIAKIALQAGGLAATALVMLDVVLGAALLQATQALY